nr:craniofacial development protein 2-like [Nicotiana tomentosiformis]
MRLDGWGKNGVGILVDKDLRELVDDVKSVNDRLMTIMQVVGVLTLSMIFIGGDCNGHIGETARGYDDVHGDFGFGVQNEGCTSLLYFARAFDLEIANSYFHKRVDHLFTFRSLVAKTQIDYLLCRKRDRGLCTDCKVILSECLSAQHRLLVMDLEIKREKKKRAVFGQPMIKWGALTEDKAQALGRSCWILGLGGVVGT